jgi:hypothetical protein
MVGRGEPFASSSLHDEMKCFSTKNAEQVSISHIESPAPEVTSRFAWSLVTGRVNAGRSGGGPLVLMRYARRSRCRCENAQQEYHSF